MSALGQVAHYALGAFWIVGTGFCLFVLIAFWKAGKDRTND